MQKRQQKNRRFKRKRGSSKVRERSQETGFFKIYILRKKASEKILAKKIWDYTIELKKTFVLRKKKIYPLLREKRREVHKFIDEQLKKEYI